ncbi:MAG: P-II family nitrogen regulator [Chloroflexi bacterium]|nr:P-II family nitrogen regulator [Chloroflexota bacterium]
MMKIEAIIRREKLEDVKFQLDDLGVQGITVMDVQGAGQQKGVVHHHRGSEYRVNLLPKLLLMTVVPDSLVEAAVDAIVSSARTGEIGDGKVFLTPVADVVRVRTRERGEVAVRL